MSEKKGYDRKRNRRRPPLKALSPSSTVLPPDCEERKVGETAPEKKEAIVGQVSINFLQKGARLNVSGLLKCSFHRGEAEKRDERGGDPRAGGGKKGGGGGGGRGEEGWAWGGGNSFGPTAHQIVWRAKNVHGSESV